MGFFFKKSIFGTYWTKLLNHVKTGGSYSWNIFHKFKFFISNFFFLYFNKSRDSFLNQVIFFFNKFFFFVGSSIIKVFECYVNILNFFIDFFFKFTLFRFFIFVCIFSFPIFCPVYFEILPTLINFFNFFGAHAEFWVLWKFLPYPHLWIWYFTQHGWSYVWHYLCSFFLEGSFSIYREKMYSIFYHTDIEDLRKTYPFSSTTNFYLYCDHLGEIFKKFSDNQSSVWLFFFTWCGLLFVLSVFLSLILTNFLGLYGVFFVTSLSLFLFWFSGLGLAYLTWEFNLTHFINFGKWFQLNDSLVVNFEFYIDSLSISFTILVLTIAFFINLYTFAYFRYEPNVSRLILFINLFVISMVLMVLASNFVVLYLGWELVGITSFFLINFWSTRMGTVKAAFKAFLFNKVSDFFLFFCLIIFVSVFSEINIISINEMVSIHTQTNLNTIQNNFSALNCLSYCLMFAAFIKSAQFGFHIWLPDSMEAPVPASALIHSATLVSAGIFLILRFYPLIELTPSVQNWILFFGSFTAFFGGLCSVFQTDIKRLLAYSTISHCGVLMFLTFFKNPDIVIIYLYVHGFFKAIMFMCTGHIIRFANNYQDMRRMGGFYKYLPFEASMSFIALWNLSGLAFSWGFYMKHFLLIDSTPNSYFNLFCFILILIGSLSGLVYSYKLYYYVFFDLKKGRKNTYFKLNNNLNKNTFFTNSSLASNFSISFLCLAAYLLCGYLIYKYINTHNINFDWSYFSNIKNNLKNFYSPFFINFYFYLNWVILILIIFIISNNWRNNLESSFKIKFFSFICVFIFFFYVFYLLLL